MAEEKNVLDTIDENIETVEAAEVDVVEEKEGLLKKIGRSAKKVWYSKPVQTGVKVLKVAGPFIGGMLVGEALERRKNNSVNTSSCDDCDDEEVFDEVDEYSFDEPEVTETTEEA